MTMMLYADTTPLVEAIASGSESRVIAETLKLLGQRNLKPAKVAGRVGIDALWGAADPAALALLASSGRLTDWMRAIPLGPEPGEEVRARLSPATPLVQTFMTAQAAVAKGASAANPELPEPLEPMEIAGGKSVHDALTETFEARDVVAMRRILLGLYATGADYRATLEALYVATRFHYVGAGEPLVWILTASEIMDMAEWGGNGPPFVYWITGFLADARPNSPVGEAARAYAADARSDLSWLRTRLAIPRNESAGKDFQMALTSRDSAAACDATLGALRAGATPSGVASGMALAIADRVNAVAAGETAALLEAGRALRYIHGVATVMRQTQHPDSWPLLYTAASAINALGAPAPVGLPASPSVPIGGLLAAGLLRQLESQVATGDSGSAFIAARRYMQIENAPRSFAGAVSLAISQSDPVTGAPSAETIPLVAAALEEYLALPASLANNGQNALLGAVVRLATGLRGDHARADRVNAAIEQAVGAGAAQN
jgi:hypothetical protein